LIAKEHDYVCSQGLVLVSDIEAPLQYSGIVRLLLWKTDDFVNWVKCANFIRISFVYVLFRATLITLLQPFHSAYIKSSTPNFIGVAQTQSRVVELELLPCSCDF
jgi:hypothetical protein